MPVHKVLLVDDSRPVAEVMAAVLDELGYRAEVAYDGSTALAAVDRYQPDIVICDISLGSGMSGFDVAQAIRARSLQPQPILIAVTAHTIDQMHGRAREAGFDLQLTKPVDFDELESVLASHLAARSSAPG